MAACTREASPSERVEARTRWQPIWGDGLPLSAVQAQEVILDEHPFGVTRRRTFLLETPLHPATFVASCEVIITPTCTSAGDGDVSWLLGFLFVSPEFRKHGFATALVNGVVEAARGAGAVAVVLFSDVGASIYERMGFAVVGGTPVDTTFAAAIGGTSVMPALALRDVPLNAPIAGSPLEPLLASPAPSAPGVAVLQLEASRIDWLASAEALRVCHGHQRALEARGCVLVAPDESLMGHAVWVADAFAQELVVLSVRAPSAACFAHIVTRARDVAARAGLARVRLWGDDAGGMAGAEVAPRIGRLPMMKALSPRVTDWAHVQRGLWY